MSKPQKAPPWLNLAAKIKQPFTPGHPRDSLRLILWSLFFPQAIGKYIATFAADRFKDERRQKTKPKPLEIVRRDPVQRRLLFHTAATLFIWTGINVLVLLLLERHVNWFLLLSGPALGSLLGIVTGSIAGLGQGIAFAVSFSFTGNVFYTAGTLLISGLRSETFYGAALGATVGLALSAAGCVKSSADYGVLKTISGGTLFILFGALLSAFTQLVEVTGNSLTTKILVTNLDKTAQFSFQLGAAFILALSRLPDYLLVSCAALLFKLLPGKKPLWYGGFNLFLPVPGVKKQLVKWLRQDWDAGLRNAGQILSYSMQYIPVIQAIREVLKDGEKDMLLRKTAHLVDRAVDWDIVFSCAIDIRRLMWRNLLQGMRFILPEGKKSPTVNALEPSMETLHQAAFSGFWYWHREETSKAVEAFSRVNSLQSGPVLHGHELYYIAFALHSALRTDDDKAGVEAIVRWEEQNRPLNNLTQPELREGTLTALRTLMAFALDVAAAVNAYSPLKRSKIVSRVQDALDSFIENNETEKKNQNTCCQPEWELIKKIAAKWQRLLLDSGWIISSEQLNRELENPYEGYSGLPVIGPAFFGRGDIMEKIEKQWATSHLMSPLVLYGQRRIGKTSILRNLGRNSDRRMLPVYLSMQRLGMVNHTGQLLFHFACAVHRAVTENRLMSAEPPNETGYPDMAGGCLSFNHFLDGLAPVMAGQKRLVLAIDEFEVIEGMIREQQIKPAFLSYLRSLIQEHHWLGVIFAGLHKMDEMGKDYQSAFYSQVQYVRVGYLSEASARKLITLPKPRFSLEYTPQLADRIYQLTSGQPYLIQRLGFELVMLWNDRFFQSGQVPPRLLTLDDLHQVLPGDGDTGTMPSDFFKSAAYYFDGLWDSITENERVLLAIMAKKETPWSIGQLRKAVKDINNFKSPGTLDRTLELTCRHDIIIREENSYRFIGQLLHKWLAREKS